MKSRSLCIDGTHKYELMIDIIDEVFSGVPLELRPSLDLLFVVLWLVFTIDASIFMLYTGPDSQAVVVSIYCNEAD